VVDALIFQLSRWFWDETLGVLVIVKQSEAITPKCLCSILYLRKIHAVEDVAGVTEEDHFSAIFLRQYYCPIMLQHIHDLEPETAGLNI